MKTMNKPAVLVTGGAGYIGSHAVLALKDAGWHVAVIDDLSNGSRDVVPEDVPFYQGSIAERVLVDSIIDERGIGAIMHFAGSIVVPESVENPLKYYSNNTLASHSLISAAVDAGVKHIIFSSNVGSTGGMGNFELYGVDLDGKNLQRLTFTDGFDGFPMFSPDGKKLVWISGRNGKVPHETNVFIADWVP